MVTDYIKQCKYAYDKLKNHIYLIVGSENITIDGGLNYNASAVSLSSITVVNGFNILYTEDDSLDERWRFNKTLKISVNGKVDIKDYSGDLYAVIETYDGTFYLVNPDFPLKFTYQFNLNEGTNQTDITLQTPSNMPTLQFIGNGLENAPECKQYALNGIKKLSMIEKEKAAYDSTNNNLKITEELKAVEFLDNTCSLSEAYDGEKTTTTIQFNISFDDYKTDWQYRLLEFKENLYRAVVYSKDNWEYYVGFNYGLQPSYSINSSSSNEFDTITITLTESSLQGCFKKQNLEKNIDSSTSWVYARHIDGIGKAYECWGMGTARYIIMAQVDSLGNQTGNYKMVEDVWDCLQNEDPYCIDTYGKYLQLNIIDTFEDSLDNRFPTSECIWYDPVSCIVETDMPSQIIFNAATSYTYSFKASCDWTIDDDNLPTGVTVSPLTGDADETYTITIANTLAPTDAIDGDITIYCCSQKRYVGITVEQKADCIYPTTVSINCLSQPVQFAYNGNCLIEITAVTKDGQAYQGLTYQIANNQLVANVPDNFTNNATVYKLYITNCDCEVNTTEITITQNRQYEMWMANCTDAEDLQTCDYICSGTSKYLKEYRYTGTTTDDWQPTGEYRMGELISTTSSDCSRLTRFSFLNHYICVDGSKYQLLEEEESLDGGTTWTTTGVAKLGDWVEDSSEFCQQTITYQWILTNNSICLST